MLDNQPPGRIVYAKCRRNEIVTAWPVYGEEPQSGHDLAWRLGFGLHGSNSIVYDLAAGFSGSI